MKWLSRLSGWSVEALRAIPALVLFVAGPVSNAAPEMPKEVTPACPPNLWAGGELHDYRQRDATEWDRWKYRDMWEAHIERAYGRMNSGDYSRNVIADLNYALERWPNHIPALQGLIRYEFAGGRRYQFQRTECYFASARAFAPNDAAVVLAEGYYYWKKGDRVKAKSTYEDALRLEPDSADAHYNLGLVLFDMKDYKGARQHARAAYAAGYPLPGLRVKLERVGQWNAATEVAAPEEQP